MDGHGCRQDRRFFATVCGPRCDLLEADSDRWSCAILGTAAGLYREQPAELDFVGLVEGAVRELRLEYQVGQRKMIDAMDFVARPVVADFHQ